MVIGVFLDLKTEFNKIRGNVFKLLKSYLTGRSQYVIYDVVKSDTLPMKCEVHQGSIRGPLLFICSMNDIWKISEILYTILYTIYYILYFFSYQLKTHILNLMS